MYLAEVERLTGSNGPKAWLKQGVARWHNFPPSVIADHGERCCRVARGWFFAMDRSCLGAGERLLGPRWIRARYKWGPTHWPLYWCEAMAHNTLDCGALAALAVSAYQGRGLRCYTVQLVQQYSQNDARNWLRNWEESEASVNWISDDLVYHEACAVLRVRDEIRIWDPTASWWISPRQFAGYGAILALRVLTPSAEDTRSFHWGHRGIAANQWQHV